eukprot:scaffold1213_cov350-Prasinococcus_capsulatus_cf.AAC.15
MVWQAARTHQGAGGEPGVLGATEGSARAVRAGEPAIPRSAGGERHSEGTGQVVHPEDGRHLPRGPARGQHRTEGPRPRGHDQQAHAEGQGDGGAAVQDGRETLGSVGCAA